MSSRYSINDYKVGIICALPKERVAVEGMLDEIHDLQIEFPGDRNVYTFGSFINPGVVQHNVVVASLGAGSYGVVSAAQVAGDIRRSFPHLKYGLMVGIAGAVSRPDSKEADIRLGDIVVGCANGVPSIVDYTRGKEISGGLDLRTELAEPPEALSRAVSALLAWHRREGPTYLTHLAGMLRRYKHYNESRWQDTYYNRPGVADILFESQPDRCMGTDDCGACLLEGQTEISRKPRDLPGPLPHTLTSEKFIHFGANQRMDYPAVFIGSIGSAHKLMKSSTSRDEVFQLVENQRKAKLLCFEMEASGIVRDWPCLVIRGICDYADSHKNDAWQNFAAATAAAYAKDLLLHTPGAQVESATPISNIVQTVEQGSSAGTPSSGSRPFYSSNTVARRQTGSLTGSLTGSSESRSVLPQLDASEQLELNRQFIQAAGAGDLDQVRSLHQRGANINSSDGPRWTPSAILWATGGYKNICDTIQRSTGANMSYHLGNLKRYAEVIQYLNANGLDWNQQLPETKSLIRQALQ